MCIRILIFLMLAMCPVAQANNDVLMPYATMTLAASGSIDQVIDPRTLKLGDGNIISLIGLDIPGLDSTPPGPIAAKAYDAVLQATKDANFKFYQTKGRDNPPTRYKIPLGLLVDTKTGEPIQIKLLKLGLARVWFDDPAGFDISPMLDAEERARQKNLGIWAKNSPYQNYAPEDLPVTSLGKIAIVTGTVQSQISLENNIYLILSGNIHKGFSLRISADRRPEFARAGLDLFSLQNKIVRVRGLVAYGHGLTIEVMHPWKIEVISDSLPTDAVLGGVSP
jgi:endonuclease YncB( thermonuclease family)